jgi:hypothetical protein
MIDKLYLTAMFVLLCSSILGVFSSILESDLGTNIAFGGVIASFTIIFFTTIAFIWVR